MTNHYFDLEDSNVPSKNRRMASWRKNIGHLVASRVAIVAIILLTQATAEIARGTTGSYMNLDGSTNIHGASNPSRNLLKADIGWYKDIADSGYTKEPFQVDGRPASQRNWAFFPGWPILWKLCGLGRAKASTGIALANILFFAGMLAMGKYLARSGLANKSMTGSFLLLASYYPFSYFFSLPLPESLFSACTAFFLLSMPRYNCGWHNTIINCVAGYASGLTRPMGIFNSIFPASEFCKCLMRKEFNPKLLVSLAVSAISPFLGLGSFMLHLNQKTGNPFAFKDIQEAWGRSNGMIFEGLIKALSPTEISTLTFYSNFRLANLTVCLVMIISILILAKKALNSRLAGGLEKRIDLAVIASYLLLLTISCSSDNQVLLSFTRIAGTNPIFLASLAICIKPRIIKQLSPVLAILLGAFTALSTVGFDAFAA